jgi:photosynthetic reaction center M subunit
LASLFCGLIAFTLIGMNMLASVNCDPIQFVRQLLLACAGTATAVVMG